MEEGNIITEEYKIVDGRPPQITIRVDWLKYMGYDPDDLKDGTLRILFKAEKSSKGYFYIGMGKPAPKKV